MLAGAVVAASVLLGIPRPASAQAQQPPSLDLPRFGPKKTEPAAERTNEPPSPEATLAAFSVVEGWVRSWTVPPASEVKGPLPRTTAACLTLRLDGRLLARAEAIAPQTSGPDAGSADLVRLAAERAIKAATPRLNVPNDALREQAILEAAKRVTISLELAGPFSAIEPATWGDVDAELAPGLDGVSVRVAGANADGAIVFPSTMLAAGMIPSAGMKACVSELVGEGGAAAALEEPKQLKAERKLEFRRFRVTHVGQSSPKAMPAVLFRGGNISASAAVLTRAELQHMADRLAGNLCARRIRLEESDAAPGDLASPSELLAAGAVARYRQLQTGAGAGCPASWPSPTLLLDVPASMDAVTVSFRALAISQRWTGIGTPMAPNLDAQLRRLYATPIQALCDPRDGFPSGMPLPVQGLAAAAVSSWVTSEVSKEGGLAAGDSGTERARNAISRAYAASGDDGLLSMMPWVGWADVALSDHQTIDLQGALTLRRMRERMWKHQLSIADAGPDNLDMVGGIVFTSGLAQGRGNPFPTWQCVRPLAFVATMLRDKRLTEPQERSGEIVRLMQAARYLRQLQVDESNAWMYSDPQQARGAIRASVWDKSTPIDATSLTLMFVTELIKSLDAIAQEQR